MEVERSAHVRSQNSHSGAAGKSCQRFFSLFTEFGDFSKACRHYSDPSDPMLTTGGNRLFNKFVRDDENGKVNRLFDF